MDVNRLSQGEKIAGASAIALILIMFIFDWFGYKASGGVGLALNGEFGARNAWGAFSFIDIILFITALAALGLAYTSASGQTVSLPVALSAIVTGLGILSVVLILFRIISPPDLSVGGLSAGNAVDTTRKIGVFLGLLAAAGLTYGGWTAMQEEGTSFGDARDQLQNRGGGPGPGPGGTTGGGTGSPPPTA